MIVSQSVGCDSSVENKDEQIKRKYEKRVNDNK